MTGLMEGSVAFVTEPRMMTLAETKDASYTRLFRTSVARVIAAQVIQAIAFLHRRGVVHAGNINNVSLAEKHRRAFPQRNYTENTTSQMSNHSCALVASPSPKWSSYSRCCTHFAPLFQCPRYPWPPPVTYFHGPLSFPADIWTLACALWDIIGQRPPFEGFSPSDDWMIKAQRGCTDWASYRATSGRNGMQGKDGLRKRLSKRESAGAEADRWFIASLIPYMMNPRGESAMESVGEAGKSALLAMFRGMLACRPSERLAAMEIVGSEWMRRWALSRCLEM
ncbi:protein kinase domain-containing protein [Blastomyces gilchristii SLH14081]|uniref:Protein kinase domain-containing protein n=1 Tax=Blastomyces gilchristii (strain SLH14081) TaxID=559298 RepID=A0A179UYL6_BLAGS|nr:protein kinase domain-containing protein [Blastomyces gilchristii SLH14081]OAT13176.1 protein kinase domain-containing protein [Blastomyces gilchristii SLH14081]